MVEDVGPRRRGAHTWVVIMLCSKRNFKLNSSDAYIAVTRDPVKHSKSQRLGFCKQPRLSDGFESGHCCEPRLIQTRSCAKKTICFECMFLRRLSFIDMSSRTLASQRCPQSLLLLRVLIQLLFVHSHTEHTEQHDKSAAERTNIRV